jgi:catechol 2,3-dioxygenase-like lactoylglutathione lyase family enzyme
MPDALGRLAGVTVAVPDPDATAAFLRDALGFVVDGDAVLCVGDYGSRGQRAIRLVDGAEAATCTAITFEVGEGFDFDALAARVGDGVAGLRFSDPAGNPLEVVPAVAVEKPPHDPVRPRRLGHVNLKAPDPPTTAAFYQDVLGMMLSEQIGEGLYFLRIGSEHHNVGLRGGQTGELHHLGFEVEGWHVYQPILDRLAERGETIEYGPGRHRPGNNIFAYLRDPSSGLRIELFADMAQIPDAAAHVPARWEAGDRMTKTINRWGPTPPASFLE